MLLPSSLFISTSLAATVSSVTIKLSGSVPTGVPSSPVPKDFCGFAFEGRSFYDYAGTPDNPTQLSKNLINEIASKTKTVPIIRVGGTTLDHAHYNRSQSKAMIFGPGQANKPRPKHVKYGPKYFDAFKTLPSAKYVLDIPFATEAQSRSIHFAEDGYHAIGAANVYALEIGNEPNLYHGKDRPAGWTVKDYATQWSKWSAAISKALDLSVGKELYQTYTLVSWTKRMFSGAGVDESWTIQKAWNQGLKDVKSRIKTVSMHYYQIEDAQSMNHAAVLKASSYIKTAANFLNGLEPRVPLVLGEAAVSIDKTDHGVTIAPALVTADFMLHSMAIGVSRVHYQIGHGFNFNLWDVQMPSLQISPGVNVRYYGYMFAAEFIGAEGNTKVASIDSGADGVAAYAAYKDGKLARFALINYHDSSSNVKLRLGDTTFTKAQVKTLRRSTVDGKKVVTLNGTHWSAAKQGVGQKLLDDAKTHKVNANGVTNTTVGARTAIIVTFE